MEKPEGDRRADHRTREKLNEIEDNWQEAIAAVRKEYRELAEMLDARYRRVVWSVLGMGGALTISVVLGFLAFRDVLHEQESSRREAIVSACNDRRGQALAIRAFVARISPELTDEVASAFPVEQNCNEYADKLLEGTPRR